VIFPTATGFVAGVPAIDLVSQALLMPVNQAVRGARVPEGSGLALQSGATSQ
jgi:hypothetical protein